jgi:hypothetical protein
VTPSDRWEVVPNAKAFLQTVGVRRSVIDDLVSTLRELSLAALVRERGRIRVVADGLGTAQVGVFVLDEGEVVPESGKRAPDGRTYDVVRPLGGGIFYYEAS